MAQKKTGNTESPHILFYNPRSGEKKKLVSGKPKIKDVLALFEKYQIEVEAVPIKSFRAIKKLVEKTVKKDCRAVIVAGGDGTIGEVANALIGKSPALGIVPLGTFVNNARALDIPVDLEKAVMTIKIGRVRKIDVGVIEQIDGERLSRPFYFLESAGIGIEAQLHKHLIKMEKGDFKAVLKVFKDIGDFTPKPMRIMLDGKREIKTDAIHLTVSNGPITGAAIKHAPRAKLNDHMLTVAIYRMDKGQLITHFLKLLKREPVPSKLIERYQAQKISLTSDDPQDIHADGRIFGKTPVRFSIAPNALSVICGFPESKKQSALE